MYALRNYAWPLRAIAFTAVQQVFYTSVTQFYFDYPNNSIRTAST